MSCRWDVLQGENLFGQLFLLFFFANSNQAVTFYLSHQNIILQSGQTVIRGECDEKCTCKAGVFSCEPLECGEEQICGKKDGAIGCYNKGIYNYKCTIKAKYLFICQMFIFFLFFLCLIPKRHILSSEHAL